MSEEHTYTMLGESGLWEDEEGNIVDPSEMEGYEPADPALKKKISERLKNFGVQAELNDKTNPDYWFYEYDPRYCGPDRQDYMERMASRARADKEQREIDYQGLHPQFSGISKKGRSLVFQGIVDHYGHMVITNEKYSHISHFRHGLAMAQDKETKKWGFIDRHGNEVIPCIWRNVGILNDYTVAVVDDKTNLAGYMDVRGKMISPCIWEDAWDFHEGLAKVQKDGRQGMINQLGELVIPCEWKALGFCSESMIPVKNDEGKCGYLNRWTKEIVIDFQWKEACMFREGLAGVQSFENNRLGYINKKGEVVIPFVWKKIRDFHNGLALVSPGKKFLWWDKWIYINKKGEYVKDFKWFKRN